MGLAYVRQLGYKQAIRLGELCQEGALVPGQGGASSVLASVQPYTQGQSEVPLLMLERKEVCLTAS